jgi:hypothetical protein
MPLIVTGADAWIDVASDGGCDFVFGAKKGTNVHRLDEAWTSSRVPLSSETLRGWNWWRQGRDLTPASLAWKSSATISGFDSPRAHLMVGGAR